MSWDKEAAGRRFAQEQALPFPVGRDADGRIADLYRVESTPHSFFIDRRGVIRHRVEGAMQESVIQQEIEKLLAS